VRVRERQRSPVIPDEYGTTNRDKSSTSLRKRNREASVHEKFHEGNKGKYLTKHSYRQGDLREDIRRRSGGDYLLKGKGWESRYQKTHLTKSKFWGAVRREYQTPKGNQALLQNDDGQRRGKGQARVR